jgi:hypothetical protein
MAEIFTYRIFKIVTRPLKIPQVTSKIRKIPFKINQRNPQNPVKMFFKMHAMHANVPAYIARI